jgi:hypothetical protein
MSRRARLAGSAVTAGAYAVLGVSPDSEDVVIRAAYRALMQKYTSLARLHEEADDRRAREIQAAYDAIETARRSPEPDAAPPPADPPQAPAMPAETLEAEPAEPPAVLPAPPPLTHAPPRRTGAAALIAAALVLAAGGAAAWWALQPRPSPRAQATASALQVRVRPAPAASPLARPMPCYVGGRSVGELRLNDCAARNGVASGPLEIGPAPPPPAVAAPPTPPPTVEAETAPPPPVHADGPDGAALWRRTKAAAVRLAIDSLAAHDQRPVAPPRAAAQPAHLPPSNTGSLNAQMAQLQALARTAPKDADAAASEVVDHLGQFLTRLAPLVHDAEREAAPPAHPPPARDEVSVPIAAPAHPAARESVAVVRDFYQALGDGDARLATTLVAPEQRDAGSLSAERIRRFAASVRQPVRVTDIRAVDDSTVAVRYQFVSSANQLCQGSADVATTERDDHVMIRGIKSTYAC